MLEHFLREDLKLETTRPMAIINPLKVIITNYPEGQIEYVDVINNTENEALGSHKMAFGRELYIEKEDFCEVKPNKHKTSKKRLIMIIMQTIIALRLLLK